MTATPPRVLAIAGSDSGGGAGIQADLKTMLALGAHGMSVVTSVTAQNSVGVQGRWDLPPAAVSAQLNCVLSDIGVSAVKTGMLGSAEVAAAVTDGLSGLDAPLVVDPVMASGHGEALLSADALAVVKHRLVPLATVVTPNLREAGLLTGVRADDERGMVRAAEAAHALGPRWVLVTGGHLPGDPVDVLFDGERTWRFTGPRIAAKHTHGTGCTLASAIACFLAQGSDVPEAVEKARQYLGGAIRWGFPAGRGTGPLDHAWRWRHPDAPQGSTG